MAAYKLKTPKTVENAVVGTYKKIEDGVAGAYKKIEDGVVGAYKRVEDKFVDTFLEKTETSYDGATEHGLSARADHET